MNRVGRILLTVGAVVLAFLIGVLVGRGHRAEPPTAEAATNSMQINTTAPEPPPAPLPTPAPEPKHAKIPTLDAKAQINADAAAVGMTTPDQPQPPSSDQPSAASASAPSGEATSASNAPSN